MQRITISIVVLGLIVLALASWEPCHAGQTKAELLSKLLSSISAQTKSVEELKLALSNSDPHNRLLAANELGKRNDKSAIGPLKQVLSDSSPEVRVVAAMSLLALGDNGGVAMLRNMVSAADARLATSAAAILAGIGDYSGIAVAKAHLDDKSSEVRGYALDAVVHSGDDDLAYSTLRTGLQDTDKYVRIKCIRFLGGRQNKRSVELLAPLASSSDANTRWLAVRAIGWTHMWDGIPLLINALSDSDVGVQYTAALWLELLTGQKKSFRSRVHENQSGANGLAQEWRDWWEANKQNYPSGQKSTAPDPTPPTGKHAVL